MQEDVTFSILYKLGIAYETCPSNAKRSRCYGMVWINHKMTLASPYAASWPTTHRVCPIHMPKAHRFTAQPSQGLENIGTSTIPARHQFITQKGLNFEHATRISRYKSKSIKHS